MYILQLDNQSVEKVLIEQDLIYNSMIWLQYIHIASKNFFI